MFPIAASITAWATIVATWAVVYATSTTPRPFLKNFTNWDGVYYQTIAHHGYVHGTYLPVFFPALPALERAAAVVLLGHYLAAVIVVQLLTAATASHGIWHLTRHHLGVQAANRTVVVWLLLPGSTILAMGYTEPLAVTAAAWCLYFLSRRRWVLAGLIAAVAGTVRLEMITLAAVCGVAAIAAVWRRREWVALAAPMLAPLGTAAYVLWMGHRLHDYHFLTHLEQKGWHNHFDYGKTLLLQMQGRGLWAVHGYTHFLYLSAGVVAVALVGVVLGVAYGVPRLWLLYTLLVVGVVLGTTWPGVRAGVKGFPVAVGYARLPRRVFLAVVGVLGVVFVLSAVWWVFPTATGAPAP